MYEQNVMLLMPVSIPLTTDIDCGLRLLSMYVFMYVRTYCMHVCICVFIYLFIRSLFNDAFSVIQTIYIFFFLWRSSLDRAKVSSFEVSRISLDTRQDSFGDWSAHPIAKTSTDGGQHNIQTQKQTSMPPSGIRTHDPNIQAALDRAATRIGNWYYIIAPLGT
jgi:hypothetical protein